MAGNIHWLKDVPPGTFYRDANHYLVTKEVFDQIGCYTRSMPTGASSGRIYRRDEHWSGPPANWFIYVCFTDPEKGCIEHRGKPALVVE